MDEIAFVVPFKSGLKDISIYVQLKEDYDFVFLKQFTIIHSIDNQDKSVTINYLLNLLKIYDYKIKNAQDFWKKLGIEINDKDISFICKHRMIYQRTSYNFL